MNLNYIKISAMALLSVLSIASCEQEVDISASDDVARVALYPAPADFSSNADTYTAVVTVSKGSDTNSGLKWNAELTEGNDFASISKTQLTSTFVETWSKKEYTSVEEGIKLDVSENTGFKRTVAFKIVLSDGTEQVYTLTQAGLKADAEVTPATSEVVFGADGGDIDLEFVSNMGDQVEFQSDAEWLTYKNGTSSKVTLTAAKWADKENGRTANFTITVGTTATSTASATVKVTQLKADLYLYMYGESVKNLGIADAIEMTKLSEGKYTASTYFMASADGKNPVIFNLNTKTAAYPCYALAADGKIAEVKSATELPQGPAIEADGLRDLTLDLNAMSWTWARVSTQNCLPDSELANYKTKSYIARDGSMKTWMNEWLRWDGGSTTPKLGSLMVPTATGAGTAGSGGYAAADFPATWDASTMDMSKETTERGGELVGTSEKGRIYTFSEIMTGEPQLGIGFNRYEPLISSWQAGATNTDGLGRSFVVETLLNADFSGDNADDEANHPMLTGQWQGICPYGWHIANASDWLDLAYAASKAAGPSETYKINEADVTYKQFSMTSGTKGIQNFAPWLRNKTDWVGGVVADGQEDFGFYYYPLGFRYMTQGFQCAGTRVQTWIPLTAKEYQAYRLNVLINNTVTLAQIASIDNGQAILPVRCVKNYLK